MMSIKKLVVLIIACLFIFAALSSYSWASETDINVQINGQKLELDTPPVVAQGRALVPLRGIFEALGAEVDWDAETGMIIGKKPNIQVVLQINNPKAKINNKETVLDLAPIISNGRTLVPVRFIAESLGAAVRWNSDIQTIEITTNNNAEANRLIEKASLLPFGPNDCTANGISLQMEMSEVLKAKGNPLNQVKRYDVDLQTNIVILKYDFGSVEFSGEDPIILDAVIINKPGIPGPRGTRVGDSLASLLGKYPSGPGSMINGTQILYSINNGESTGTIYYNNGQATDIIYGFGGCGFGSTYVKYKLNKGLVSEIRLQAVYF